MTPDKNGVYRWRYSMNLYKNASLLWLFYKVFGGIYIGLMLFVLFIDGFNVSLAGVKWACVGFAVMMAIVTLSYYALIQGGRYTWDFEMDDKGVNATQVANEAKKTKAIGMAVAAMGVATGNLSQIGVGTVVASRDGMYSPFDSVGSVKSDRRHNTIKIRNGLNHNQVFASDEDFDFILEYVAAHCPKAIIKR